MTCNFSLTEVGGYRVIGMQVAVVSALDWRHFRRYHYKRGSMAPLQRDYENAHRFSSGHPR